MAAGVQMCHKNIIIPKKYIYQLFKNFCEAPMRGRDAWYTALYEDFWKKRAGGSRVGITDLQDHTTNVHILMNKLKSECSLDVDT